MRNSYYQSNLRAVSVRPTQYCTSGHAAFLSSRVVLSHYGVCCLGPRVCLILLCAVVMWSHFPVEQWPFFSTSDSKSHPLNAYPCCVCSLENGLRINVLNLRVHGDKSGATSRGRHQSHGELTQGNRLRSPLQSLKELAS